MATLAASGAISIGTLNSFFTGSGTAMSNFYRGGGRVPSTRTVREPTSGAYYDVDRVWNYLGFAYQEAFWFGSVAILTAGETSFTSGIYTYFRGSFQENIPYGEGSYQAYSIYRTYQQAINTGVPSSGTISLSDFYGAVDS